MLLAAAIALVRLIAGYQISQIPVENCKKMTTSHDFPELKNDLLLRAARGTPFFSYAGRAVDLNVV